MRYLTLLLLGCILTGCGGDPIQTRLSDLNKENYQKASTMYAVYSSLNSFKGPANADEMVEFLSTNEKAAKRLEMVGMDTGNLEEYLIGRDGEPFRFRWSVQSNPLSPPYPVVFEEKGIDGVRQVAFTGKKMVEVTDDAEYDRLFKGKLKTDEVQKFDPTLESVE